MVYASIAETYVYFSFEKIFADNYFEFTCPKALQSYVFASLNLKKEVLIFRDEEKKISFSKGRHVHFDEDYIYLNPSIRNKIKSIRDVHFDLNFISLCNYLKTYI